MFATGVLLDRIAAALSLTVRLRYDPLTLTQFFFSVSNYLVILLGIKITTFENSSVIHRTQSNFSIDSRKSEDKINPNPDARPEALRYLR